MRTEISFKTLSMSKDIGGSEGRCRCNVIHSDVMTRDDMAKEMAETMRMDEVEARHGIDAVCAYIVRALSRGRKLNFGEFSLSLSIRGTVDGANGEFVPGQNEVRVNIQAGCKLKDALAKMRPVNATAREESARPRIASVIDAATREENTVTPGEKLFVSGAGLLVNPSANDEGVWLEASGVKVLRGRIIACGATTLDCVFDAALEPGDYSMAVYSRGGDPWRPAPAKARRKVRVAPPAAISTHLHAV